jgi:ubiquinone/menaquinone biosynthesis C-methylase UbiE
MENTEPVFDQIAEFYDRTRRAPLKNEIDAIIRQLDGSKTVLEIGVGTGRISKPIQEAGFDVTGIDISVRMLEKAKEKGIGHLVIGDARNLPFLDSSFDATLIVHVFHLIEDNRRVMQEAGRVTRKMVMSIVREHESADESRKEWRREVIRIFSETCDRMGYGLNTNGPSGHRQESAISEVFKPSRKILIDRNTRTVNPENFAERFRYSSRYVSLTKHIPEKELEKILDSVRKEVSSMGIKHYETTTAEYLLVWNPGDLY